MDYLRRLNPAHADCSSAARLDAPAAMMAMPVLPSAAFEEVVAPLSTNPAVARAAKPGPAPVRTIQRPPSEPSLRAAPLTDVATPRAVPSDRPATAPTALAPIGIARLPVPPSLQPARATPPSVDAEPAVVTPLLYAEAGPSPAARRPESSVVAVLPQPLRPEAVRERERAAADEPAPIIHVTIDRIDVRLPSAAATPPALSRRRAAPAVGALGDYLRGRPPEGRS